MPTILKKLLKVIVLIVLLLAVGITALLVIIDPDDYRADIEQQAKLQAGINLKIEGELSWSLLPIGINVNRISVRDQHQQAFSSFNNLTLQIDTVSLLQLNPKVKKLLLDGLDVELKKDIKGKANWENLIARKNAATKAPESTVNEPVKEGSRPQLSFLVEQLEISNARFSYLDLQNDQILEASKLTLSMRDIALDQAFPVSLSYQLVNENPNAEIKQNLSGKLKISSDFKQIAIESLNSAIQVTSDAIAGKTLNARMGGDILIDTAAERISLNNVIIGLANIESQLQLAIANYSTEIEILGKISIRDFSLPELLTQLGQQRIPTSDPEALSKLAFSSKVKLVGDALSLPSLSINVDQSNWQGNLDLNLKTQALALDLQGDQITIDDYLPPEGKTEATAKIKQTESKQTGDEPLLPLETIRDLDLAINFKQQAITAKDMKFKDLKLEITAKDGHLQLKHASTKLFEGQIDTTASLNAKSDKVLWDVNTDVSKLNILEHLGDIEAMGYQLGGAGNINLTANFNSQGNSINSLQQFAKANAKVNVIDGAVTGINLNQMACEGFAYLNRDQVTKSDWPNETRFNMLEAEVSIDGQVIESRKLAVENIGLKALGQGTVNLAEKHLNYELELTPVGDLGDEACQVREKIKDIAIPIKCEGALGASPASLCGLNYKKLGQTAEKLAKKEAKRKIEKEVDRALDKQIDKHLGGDKKAGKELKKLFKGLF